MKRFLGIALLGLASLTIAFGATLNTAVAEEFQEITGVGPCSDCSFIIEKPDGRICYLADCRDSGLRDPWGNPFYICVYSCPVKRV